MLPRPAPSPTSDDVRSATLGELTWIDVDSAMKVAGRPLLAIPIGSCEQHGAHLPLDTDTRIACALADALACGFEPDQIVIAPPIAVSASGEHAGFPGTLSLGTAVLEALLVELVRSADWSAGCVLVNGHGGNAEAVGRATATLTAEGRRVLTWWPRIAGADAHAGHTETSIVLALAPDLVRLDSIDRGRTEPIGELIEALRERGVRSVSPNGVLGDPTRATAEYGRAMLDELAADLIERVRRWHPTT